MKPAPRPPLEVVQAQLLLHLLIALLHRPAAPPEPDRLDPARSLGEVAESVFQLAVGLLLDQQPDRIGARAVAGGPAVPGPDPQPGEPTRHRPLGPLPPGDLPPRRPLGQLLQADRPGRALGHAVAVLRAAAGGRLLLDPLRL